MYDAIMRQPQSMEDMLSKHSNAVQPVGRRTGEETAHISGGHRHLVARRVGRGPLVSQVRRDRSGHRGPALLRVLRLSAQPHGGRRRGGHQPPRHQDLLVPGIGDGQEQRSVHRRHHINGARAPHHRGRRPVSNGSPGAVRRFHGQLHHCPDGDWHAVGSHGGWTDQSGDVAQLRARLDEIPAASEQVLARQGEIQRIARRFQSRQRFLCAGWGPNTASAYEVALKIKETSACDSEGLQIEQLLHGPFCSVDQKCLVTIVAPPGFGYERAMNVTRASTAVARRSGPWSRKATLCFPTFPQRALPCRKYQSSGARWSTYCPSSFSPTTSPSRAEPILTCSSRTTPCRPPPGATMNSDPNSQPLGKPTGDRNGK